MRKYFFYFILLGFMQFTSQQAWAADETVSCRVIAVEGRAFVTNLKVVKQPLRLGQMLEAGDQVETGIASYADLAYDSDLKNIVRIEESSKAVIRGTILGTVTRLERGGVYAKLKNLPKDSSFQVETPVAIATVRGSEYRTMFDTRGGARVFNFGDSPVIVRGVDASGNPAGDELTLKNSEKTEVARPGDAPSAAQSMDPGELGEGNAIAFGLDENTKVIAEDRTQAGAGEPSENPVDVLQEMAQAYQDENLNAFMARVSDSYPYHGELSEFAHRDFMDYDGIRINLFISRTVKTPEGGTVRADWQMQCFPTATTRSIEIRGSDLEFIFVRENGKLKLSSMRGANPLFGSRSPEIAAESGASSSAVSALQTIEDTGNRPARQSAITVTAAQVSGDSAQNTPVGIELSNPRAKNISTTFPLPGTLGGATTYNFLIDVSLVDNPRNAALSNTLLEVTESRSGQVLRARADLLPNRVNTIETSDSVLLPTGSGSVTYVLDPEKQFSIIDRNDARRVETYNV